MISALKDMGNLTNVKVVYLISKEEGNLVSARLAEI